MSNKYRCLLSPIKIRNVTLKNRIMHANSLPHFLQGPETFPSEALINHFAGVANNGAAIVTFPSWGAGIRPRKNVSGDSPHFAMFDIEDAGVQNYIAQLAEAIHFHDSKVFVSLRMAEFEGYNICELPKPSERFKRIGQFANAVWPVKVLTIDMMQEMIENLVIRAKLFKTLGFEGANIYMSYRNSSLAYSLSPDINKRTDKYGGSHENRARFSLELFQAIKEACGQDFLVSAQISGEEVAGGYTIEDTVKYAKIWEDAVDILELRAWDGGASHPIGFNSQKKYPVTLQYAQAIKESGVNVITAPVGGYQDLDLNEEYIATGKTDLVCMARAFICDPEYGKKAYEGRGYDVVPCIRCNKCHGTSWEGPWHSICSVNPKMGILPKVLERMIEPVGPSKKVAVIGGGPAGMKAALVSAERGHEVTLYEKEHFLGGQLRHADFASFKWPIMNFKDYLIRQLDKEKVDVRLNTEVTPEMIREKGYDAVLVAVGSESIISTISGADNEYVWKPINVFGNEKALGKNVVVIGGGSIGVETGMYLAENGHKVTVLEMLDMLAHDASPIHYWDEFRDAWEQLENFKYVLKAKCNTIEKNKVTYTDDKNKVHTIKTDDVVIAVGLKSKNDFALTFYGSADRFFIIGDCSEVGSVQKSIRSAFAAASKI